MRVIHKGYAATVYGRSSLSVTDPNGREIFHTDERNDVLCTENGLREIIETIIEQRKANGESRTD